MNDPRTGMFERGGGGRHQLLDDHMTRGFDCNDPRMQQFMAYDNFHRPDPRMAMFGGPRGGCRGGGGRGRGGFGLGGLLRSLFLGSGGRGMFGPRDMFWHNNESSDEKSDSDCEPDDINNDSNTGGCRRVPTNDRKSFGKHKKAWKRLHRLRSPWYSADRSHCTLCVHTIRPLVDTDVLDCGHLYHRRCLRGLIEKCSTETDGQTVVNCIQCRQRVDNRLVAEFKKRFADSGDATKDTEEVMA